MSIITLTPSQLRQAADLKEKIAALEKQLAAITGTGTVKAEPKAAQPAKRKMSAAHIAKIRAAQKLRWAKHNAAKASVKVVKKGGMSTEGKARIVAAQKLRWAKVKAAKTQSPVAKAVVAVKPASVTKPAKKKISPEGIARIKAAQKARWAAIKAAKK
jgi:hypothetical protein